jgi:nitrate reductase NapA
MNLDRREFLHVSALAAATAVVTQRLAGQSSPAAAIWAPAPAADGIKWDKAPCRFCGTGCHVRVGVKDGRVVAIQGERLAAVNKGLLCVKGYHVGGILYGKDRLTTPLLRRSGRMEPISWEEAIDIMAKRIMAKPEAFAFYGSGQWTIPEGYAAQKFMKGGLANNHIEPNARLCMASAVTGYLSVYGVDEPAGCYDDLDSCDVVIMWGNNPAEMHPVLFSRIIDRRARGEKIQLIDIGTRRTRTTEYCDEYLEFRPQSDLAIANGIAHLLLANDTWDKAFVAKHCNFRGDKQPLDLMGQPITFEDYKKSLATYTPDYVEKISGIPAAKIRQLAELFGRRDVRITSLWCMGMNQHTRGTAINRLVHSIHLLSGHFGRPGDAPTSLTGQPSACGTAREVGTLCHFLPGGRLVADESHRKETEEIWKLPAGRINPKPGHHTVLMWEKFCTPTDKGGDISTMFVQVTNPGHSLPNLHKLFTAKQGLADKFLIVSEVYPTATTEIADLVLPAALWVEKNGIYGNSERRTQQWFKQVEPPGQARPDAWMTIALARRLFELGHPGMKDREGNFIFAFKDEAGRPVPAWEFAHYEDINVDRALYEEYRQFSYKKHKHLAPYDVLAQSRGLRWPVVQTPTGEWKETTFRFTEGTDPFVEKGKGIQFYHSVTKDDKALIWFCAYEPPAESPDGDYPTWLCTGRVLEHWHTGTMTMRVPQLRNAMPNAYVEMHPDDAALAGLANGDLAVVESRRGRIELPVWINGRAQPPRGSVFVPFFDERLMINEVTLGETCPISKEPDYKKCAVRVFPKGGKPNREPQLDDRSRAPVR